MKFGKFKVGQTFKSRIVIDKDDFQKYISFTKTRNILSKIYIIYKDKKYLVLLWKELKKLFCQVGSKVSSIAGTMACMIWKGTPYYAYMEYNDKKDPADGLPDEDVTAIDEIPVYSINKPKPESLIVLKILNDMKEGREGRPKMMKKGRLIEELEEHDVIGKNLSIGAKHSKLKGLLSSISIAGSDNPLVEVEYKGKQSNVILTSQGQSTLKIFGE